MIFLTINSLVQAKEQILSSPCTVDGLELRLDRFLPFEPVQIHELLERSALPIVLTLRKKEQGGSYTGTEIQRLKLIQQLLQYGPDYFDLEYDTSLSFLEEVARCHPRSKLILSYHNFQETPDLESIFEQMHNTPAFAYKIACQANSIIDSLRMNLFAKKRSEEGYKIIAICMGNLGESTRILSNVNGTFLTYATNQEGPSVEEQLAVQALQQTYGAHQLTSSSKLYGLIGDPVEGSLSHTTHNFIFRSLGHNAVYIKFPVKSSELREVMLYFRHPSFQGFSVTMPHKETICPLLDHISPEAQAIGAVNTIVREQDQLWGYNTDGLGALDALERVAPVHKKKMMIIGAGGTAKAIAYEALKRGAVVTIFNRTESKAKEISTKFGCSGFGLEKMEEASKEGYDILVHATSLGMLSHDRYPPFDLKWILPRCIVFDVLSAAELTPILKEAKKKECVLISGRELFFHQAAYQFRLWLAEEVGKNPLYHLFKSKFFS